MSARSQKVGNKEEEPVEGTGAVETVDETGSQHRLVIPSPLTVKQLAEIMDASGVEVIKQLMRNDTMANINQVIDYDTAAIVASDFGFEPVQQQKTVSARRSKKLQELREGDARLQKPRPPVVTIMGHVDHGKTSLLDAIRETKVTATEVGEITQHIGAYQVELEGKKITFLDTPGHEAFTAMRARGAQVTDITILVVAADDGVMPQTVEAIDHARAAGVPIVVAVNKVDKADANPQRVKQQLADLGLVCEEWGGEVVCVEVSAKKKEGISNLLENLIIVAEMEELKANPEGRAAAVVVEAKLDKTKGPLATVLVQSGVLKVGDSFHVGETWGRVKAMFDDKSKHMRRAEPATPVEVLGFQSVPQAGDILRVVVNEKEARNAALKRQEERRLMAGGPRRALGVGELSAQIREGRIKELNLILKTDVQGSIEPIRTSLERLVVGEVKANVLHSGSGGITEGDVLLALASGGIVLGFNTRIEPGAKQLADSEGIDIRSYQVIYNLVEDVEKLLTGMLEPVWVEVLEGHAEVRVAFSVRGRKVAGVYVTDGAIRRGSQARVIRGGETIVESSVSSLRRFKDDVREVAAGFECGLGIEGFGEFEIGDIIESYGREKQ
ncbi:MAG: translation initiation factor IF-2 [Chloroflexota bacterium]|nr:translation initiation factor IF-2 [Chloroflexota bacterium]